MLILIIILIGLLGLFIRYDPFIDTIKKGVSTTYILWYNKYNKENVTHKYIKLF